MVLPTSFYVQDGGAFVASELTRGPWSNQHQHGGPPAALLAGAMEAFENQDGQMCVARFGMELLKPVPLAALRVEVELEKRGQRVDRLQGRLLVEGQVVASARALRIRRRSLDVDINPLPLPRGPDTAPPFTFTFFQHDVGYHRAVELRFVRGQWMDNPVFAWMRPLVPLVAGRVMTPLERVMTVVDAESGVCPPLDPHKFSFVNPDLNVLLDRPAQGEWIGLDVSSSVSPLGMGMAQSGLFDERGAIGRSAQLLVVDERRP